MRSVRYAAEAQVALRSQLQYLIDNHAVDAANALNLRIETYLTRTLAPHPRIGRYIADKQVWERGIPRTRLIAWYTFSATELVVVSFWHSAQNRPAQ